MAIKIIDQTSRPRQYTGVSVNKTCWWCDQYEGTAEALVAAGVVTADQLPGQPGGPKVAATYYAGVLRSTRGFIPKDEHYLNITRPRDGKKVKVVVGLSSEEAARRQAKRDAEREVAQAAHAIADRRREYRLMGKKFAWMLWSLVSAEGRSSAGEFFNLELTEGGTRDVGEAINKIWSVFDQDSLREVIPMRAAAIAAAKDSKFQEFLTAQCIASEGRGHA